VEKLRDEALRNGNVNWSKGHVIVAEFVRDTLINSGLFDESSINEIRRDINGLLADCKVRGQPPRCCLHGHASARQRVIKA